MWGFGLRWRCGDLTDLSGAKLCMGESAHQKPPLFATVSRGRDASGIMGNLYISKVSLTLNCFCFQSNTWRLINSAKQRQTDLCAFYNRVASEANSRCLNWVFAPNNVAFLEIKCSKRHPEMLSHWTFNNKPLLRLYGGFFSYQPTIKLLLGWWRR